MFAVEGGHDARNSSQQWLTHFDGRGFSVEPDSGGWTWGLQLERYGFAGHEHPVAGSMQVEAIGQRISYQRDDTLREWYVNDARGLEQGFTLTHRPAQGQRGPLTLAFAIRGELTPLVLAGGRGVSFLDGDGASVVTYGDLAVLDADGTALPAHFEAAARGLLLLIDEGDARYPLTVDPAARQAYLKASNTGDHDGFGSSVAIVDDTVVVGAPGEGSNATGVNGNQSNNRASQSGAAYVFVRSGSTWTQQAYLKASNTGAWDGFGSSVAAFRDTIVVGARGEDSSATGVDGNESNNGSVWSGAAYVFVRSGTAWSQQAYLKPSNTGEYDEFGWAVSVAGDTVAVGAPNEESNATGVNGDQSDNSAYISGACYVFTRSGSTWTQQAYLKASNTDAYDFFGTSVSVGIDTILVGSPGEQSNATGVNGAEGDNSLYEAGAAYVFVRSGTSWSQQAYLKASGNSVYGEFGDSVSVSGDSALVGSSAAVLSGVVTGAAYVFVRSGTSWSQEVLLCATDADAYDLFGWSVALSGDVAVVGAYLEASNATGLDGNRSDNSAIDSGAAYVFTRSGSTWTLQTYVKSSNSEGGDLFGISVAVSGHTVVVGAAGECGDATGVNGDESDNSSPGAGAAYVIQLDPGAW